MSDEPTEESVTKAGGLVRIGDAEAEGEAVGGVAEDAVAEPEAAEFDPSAPGMVNIRNLSIKCGNCDTYQTLAAFSRRDDWNVYSYECENERCDPAVTRTYVEVPQDIDAFARRDPGWRGGRVHGGGDG